MDSSTRTYRVDWSAKTWIHQLCADTGSSVEGVPKSIAKFDDDDDENDDKEDEEDDGDDTDGIIEVSSTDNIEIPPPPLFHDFHLLL